MCHFLAPAQTLSCYQSDSSCSKLVFWVNVDLETRLCFLQIISQPTGAASGLLSFLCPSFCNSIHPEIQNRCHMCNETGMSGTGAVQMKYNHCGIYWAPTFACGGSGRCVCSLIMSWVQLWEHKEIGFFFFLNNNKRNQRYCVIFRAAKGKQLCAVNTEHLWWIAIQAEMEKCHFMVKKENLCLRQQQLQCICYQIYELYVFHV